MGFGGAMISLAISIAIPVAWVAWRDRQYSAAMRREKEPPR
jgi:hypothetical protein